MDKEKKNRSGSQSNEGSKPENTGNRRRTNQPGAPSKSNEQSGDNNRQDRDNSARGTDRNTTKKGPNSI